jgi:hypothetical protein
MVHIALMCGDSTACRQAAAPACVEKCGCNRHQQQQEQQQQLPWEHTPAVVMPQAHLIQHQLAQLRLAKAGQCS